MQSLFIIRPKNTKSKQQHTNYLVMSAVYTIYKNNLCRKTVITENVNHMAKCS